MPHKMGEIELFQNKPWDIILERFRTLLRYEGHQTRLIGTHIFEQVNLIYKIFSG